MRIGFALAITVSASLVSFAASANGGGVAGYSGKPTQLAPQGESCNQCHNGGTKPQVQITGPASLAAGQSAEYKLVVGANRAGADIAATDGIVLTPVSGGGLRDSFGEMVHDGPRTGANGQTTFTFKVTAPAYGNTLRLWAIGLAASGGTGGGGTQITRDITVTGGGTPPPDAGAPPSSSSGGTSSGSTPSGDADGGTKSTTKGGASTSNSGATGDDDSTADESDDDDSPSSIRRRSANDQAGSCSAAPGSGSSTAVLGASVLVLFGLAGRKRRRRA